MQAHVPGAALVRAALLGSPLLAVGCPNIPPQMERNYFRVGAIAIDEKVAAGSDVERGPYPGMSLALGTFMSVPDTRGLAFEGEIEAYTFRSTATLKGTGYRALVGFREFWNLDGRVRPSLAGGLSFADSRLAEHAGELDPKGPGGWGEAALDWMLTSRFGIGAHLRALGRYEQAEHDHGFKPGFEAGLHAIYRF